MAELKRDKAPDTVDMQALKYAAYCSTLTREELIEEYARFHDVEPDQARADLIAHAPSLEEADPGPVRMRLVAGGFDPPVIAVVLWLREFDIDIGCIEVTAHAIDDGSAVVSTQQLIPLPEAESFQVRRRRREQSEERRREQPEWTWERYEENFPAERLAVAKELSARLHRYVDEHDLPWQELLRESWLGFMRPGGYYVPVIGLRSRKPVHFSVKLPDDPERLGLTSPYTLRHWWDQAEKQWNWDVPDLQSVPDVALAVEISRRFQPETGPMQKPDAPVSEDAGIDD